MVETGGREKGLKVAGEAECEREVAAAAGSKVREGRAAKTFQSLT